MHKIAIIVSTYNKTIGDRLLTGAISALKDSGLSASDWHVREVPGAFEIPYMAQKLIDEKKYDGIIALGCVLQGETDHYRAVCDGVMFGIQKVSIENRVPVMLGVLMCNTMDEALKRSGSDPKTNKGYECAVGLLKILNSNI